MNLTDEEIASLEARQSGAEWRAACDKIKAAREGRYPPDWWPRIKLSGFMDRVLARRGASSELTIRPIGRKSRP